MATPRADTYSAASGGAIYAGMAAPSSLPLWLQGKPLNEWFQIANTALMATGAAGHAFCGMALAERAGRAHCVVAAAGGHSDSFDNRVVSLDLMADVPAWTLRHANTGSVSDPGNQRYTPDGRPVSRHTYWNTYYVPQIDRVMLIGGSGVWGYTTQMMVDGFDLGTNLWDGVVPDYPGLSGSGYDDALALAQKGAINPATGDIWAPANYFEIYRWSATGAQGAGAVAKKQMKVSNFGTVPDGPQAWDTARNKWVHFGTGGTGGSAGSIVSAFIYAADGLSRVPLTFNASAAQTAMANWIAAQAAAGNADTSNVTYDPVADRFYWFNAAESPGNRLYVVTPNAGTAWDIALHTQGAGTVTPPAAGFTYNRFTYVPSLNGLVYVPANSGQNQNVHFMRLR